MFDFLDYNLYPVNSFGVPIPKQPKNNTKQERLFFKLCDLITELERTREDIYVVITNSGCGVILKLCDSSDNSWLDDTYVTSYRVGKQVLKDWFITK